MFETDEGRFQLSKAIIVFAEEAAPQHQWLWESERWHELLFALLSQIARGKEASIRGALSLLGPLQLLDPSNLSNPHHANIAVQRISDVLSEFGLTEKEVAIAVTTIVEAASSVQRNFNGRLQRYLRQYAEIMLAETAKHFEFTALGAKAVHAGFSLWLQNVANMPVPLTTPEVDKFCRSLQLEPNELVEISDELDLNVAFIDDVIRFVGMEENK